MADLLTPQQAAERLRFGHLPIAETRLRNRIAYQRAFAHNCAVTEWDPSGEAAAEVLRLLAEITNHLTRSTATVAANEPGPMQLMRTALRRFG